MKTGRAVDDPREASSWLQKLALMLGGAEIAAALGAGFAGCARSVDAPGPSGLVMLVAFALPIALVGLPGLALAKRWRWAWLLQPLPVAFALIYGAGYFGTT